MKVVRCKGFTLNEVIPCIANKNIFLTVYFDLPQTLFSGTYSIPNCLNPNQGIIPRINKFPSFISLITFTFQNQKNETVAEVSLVRVGFGWRFDGGGRCVSGEES